MKCTTSHNLPLYLKPEKVEQLMGISIRTLRNGVKKGYYVQGKHFYIPDGKTYAYWDTNALSQWMTSSSQNSDIDNLVDSILNNK